MKMLLQFAFMLKLFSINMASDIMVPECYDPQSQRFTVGQQVRCRNYTVEKWKYGIVTSLNPVYVKYDLHQEWEFKEIEEFYPVFKIGQYVRGRNPDSEWDTQWTYGVVTHVFPVKILKKPFYKAHEYDEIEPVDVSHMEGHPDIFKVICKGVKEGLQFLMQMKADINLPNKNGVTPLKYALDLKNLEMTRVLIENNCDVEETFQSKYSESFPLATAVEHESDDIMKLLVEMKADVKRRINDHPGDTMVHLATKFSPNPTIVKLLLELKCDIDAKNKRGETALYVAADVKQKDTVEVLVSLKADINATNDGETALKNASMMGDNDMMQFLLDMKGDVTDYFNLGILGVESCNDYLF